MYGQNRKTIKVLKTFKLLQHEFHTPVIQWEETIVIILLFEQQLIL